MLQRNLTAVLVACCLAASAPSALAADPAWYFVADLGQSHFEDLTADGGPIKGFRQDPGNSLFRGDIKDRDTAFRFAAGFQLTRRWAFEAAYVDFGTAHGKGGLGCCERPVGITNPSIEVVDTSVAVRGLAVSAVATWFMDDAWSVSARFGMIDARVKETDPTVRFADGSNSRSSDNLRITAGASLNRSLSAHTTLRLGWDQFRHLGDSAVTGETNVSFISLGLVYALH